MLVALLDINLAYSNCKLQDYLRWPKKLKKFIIYAEVIGLFMGNMNHDKENSIGLFQKQCFMINQSFE